MPKAAKAHKFNSRSSFQDIPSVSSAEATHRPALRSYPLPVAQTEIRGVLIVERPIDEPEPRTASTPGSRRSVASPYERGLERIRRTNMKREPVHDLSFALVSDDDNNSDEDDEDDDDYHDHQRSTSKSQASQSCIAKPVGEVGRPKRGGYNLKAALHWVESEYKALQKHVNTSVDTQMDPMLSFTKQPKDFVLAIQTSAIEKFPRLSNYESCWPVSDLIRMRLHYKSERARLGLEKQDAKLGRALLHSGR